MSCAWIAEEEDKMAFSPENQQWIRDEIDRAIRATIYPVATRFLHSLRDWSITAALVTVPIALLGGVIVLGVRVASDIRDEATFRTHTDDRLKAIEVSLNDLQHPSPLQGFVRMDQAQFGQELGKITDTVSWAQQTGAIDNVETIDAIQKKMAALPLDTPDAARAASAIITYASYIREKRGLFPNAAAARSKACNFFEGPNISLTRVLMRGCGQVIDGIHIQDSTFENAVITYNGGPLYLQNVTFINCLFVVSLPVQPSALAKRFTGELLAKSVGPKPTFTASGG
ncbi:MAG: hypothetical protein ABSC05_19875 [Candidatus Solibacter sp.]|jgi:hypothetical protein